MTVDDVGAQLGQAQRFHHAFGKEDKTVMVVFVIALPVAVESAAVEEFLAADKIEGKVLAR